MFFFVLDTRDSSKNLGWVLFVSLIKKIDYIFVFPKAFWQSNVNISPKSLFKGE